MNTTANDLVSIIFVILVFLTIISLILYSLVGIIMEMRYRSQMQEHVRINEPLQEKDMTPYELTKWFKQNRPELDLNFWTLSYAISLWQKRGYITKYTKFDPAVNRNRIYLHWAKPNK